MAKERTREDVEWDLKWEKGQKKLLLICSAICTGIGLIIGVVYGISEGELSLIFMGIWFGAGAGNAISYLPAIPHMFKRSVMEGGGCLGEGCLESVKDLLIGIVIWLVIFSFLGPIGLLIRVLIGNSKIKRYEEELSGYGQ